MKRAEEANWKSEGLSESYLSFLRSHLDNRMHVLARRAGGGISRWLSRQWEAVSVAKSPLSVRAKIQLGPRHQVTLLDADGARLLVATSTDGHIAFHGLSAIDCAEQVGVGMDVSGAYGSFNPATESRQRLSTPRREYGTAQEGAMPMQLTRNARAEEDRKLLGRGMNGYVRARGRAGMSRVSW